MTMIEGLVIDPKARARTYETVDVGDYTAIQKAIGDQTYETLMIAHSVNPLADQKPISAPIWTAMRS